MTAALSCRTTCSSYTSEIDSQCGPSVAQLAAVGRGGTADWLALTTASRGEAAKNSELADIQRLIFGFGARADARKGRLCMFAPSQIEAFRFSRPVEWGWWAIPGVYGRRPGDLLSPTYHLMKAFSALGLFST